MSWLKDNPMDMENKQPVRSFVGRVLGWVERVGNAHPVFYYTLPLTACIVTIMIASLIPSRDIPKVHVSDKLVHGLMYAGLGWLMVRAWVRDRRASGAAVLIVAGVCSAWGFYIECLQSLTPDRGFDLIDQSANTMGAVFGVGLWVGWQRVFSRIIG